MDSRMSLRVAIVGPRANFMPSSIFATSTPDVISTDMPSASNEFEFRVILPEKTFQVALQHRLHAMERLQHRNKRPCMPVVGFLSKLPAKASCRSQDQHQIDRAGNKSEK